MSFELRFCCDTKSSAVTSKGTPLTRAPQTSGALDQPLHAVVVHRLIFMFQQKRCFRPARAKFPIRWRFVVWSTFERSERGRGNCALWRATFSLIPRKTRRVCCPPLEAARESLSFDVTNRSSCCHLKTCCFVEIMTVKQIEEVVGLLLWLQRFQNVRSCWVPSVGFNHRVQSFLCGLVCWNFRCSVVVSWDNVAKVSCNFAILNRLFCTCFVQ